LASGRAVTLQVQLTSGQTGSFEVQSTTSLNLPIIWTTVNNVIWTQTGPNTFQAQLPIQPGPAQFFRIGAVR